MALHQRTSAAALLAACLAAAAAAAPVGDGAVNAYGQPLLTPSTFTMRGRQVFYEIPAAPILGVLAMMHGCAHDASDFWPRDASACPECDGLPEEVAHTKQALARGYAAIAVDASDATRCFGWHADGEDVAAILQHWIKQNNFTAKPLYLVGVSAGASLVLKLPRLLRVHGVISEVLGVQLDAWGMEELGAAFPPTAYVSMPRDARTAARIADNQLLLRRYGVPTDVLLVQPQPFTSDFLSNRSALFSPELAAKVVAALRATGLLDGAGVLLQDPRYTALPWRARVAAAVPELAAGAGDSLVADASHVGEELNRAYAMHEIVGDHLTACLAWLEARGTLPLAGLAQQFAAARLPGPRLRDLSPRRLGMLPMRRRR
ncbi:hypothetical protein CHLNCDRAFT_51615 [Chlorella variabilis]|uniref:Serine aminopeptidase S33 domain-containing protein n=1 Tax=Chlorella variabilis TaxID=554065 RepID=E1ZBD4_CHLVA|nr:hypothetical protein CHLNCDRAFT_51615 [Chlorella variabilis]EFN56835.1 hypothetical protein CHLNCDRAFT_51615 [Chlorella variabilis]|eukprot:XP_005848937.1 hypothetical protein CHLNCDRAFT_51615 [Chlorella variabilis]